VRIFARTRPQKPVKGSRLRHLYSWPAFVLSFSMTLVTNSIFLVNWHFHFATPSLVKASPVTLLTISPSALGLVAISAPVFLPHRVADR
jgi:hypothetical protein